MEEISAVSAINTRNAEITTKKIPFFISIIIMVCVAKAGVEPATFFVTARKCSTAELHGWSICKDSD